jgi:molecular chaperone DnaK (HSP70)
MESTVNLPFITADQTGPKHMQMTINRSKFEQLIGPLVEKCRQPVLDGKWHEEEHVLEPHPFGVLDRGKSRI